MTERLNWTELMFNGLPWKWTDIILSFLRLHPSTAFSTLIDYEGYSISSKGFLLIVVDTMVIWIKFVHSHPSYFTDSSDVSVHSCHLLIDHVLFTLTRGPNIPYSYATMFFTAWDFTFPTRHIHNWASFLLWSKCLIISQIISNCPLLFPSRILDTFQL